MVRSCSKQQFELVVLDAHQFQELATLDLKDIEVIRAEIGTLGYSGIGLVEIWSMWSI